MYNEDQSINLNDVTLAAPDGVLVVNKKYQIIAFNRSASRITGFAEEEIIMHHVSELLGDENEAYKYIKDAFDKGTTYSNVLSNIFTAGRDSLSVLISITPFQQPSSGVLGATIVFRDTEEMLLMLRKWEAQNKAIQNDKKMLEAIFHSRMEGTFTIDKEWEITSFNRSAEVITGFPREEALGSKCWEVFRTAVVGLDPHMEKTMKECVPSPQTEMLLLRKDGSKVPIRGNCAPLFDGEGNHIGAVETFMDISEIKNLSKHIEERYHFDNIIGRSKSMQQVYALMENVMQSDSTVLITGQSGTGKEIVARAIHLHSDRKSQPFMAVNCSAFAETLLESELFGHEKGAFTGAIKTKAGRFELAKEGTLFLDEIGDISLPVQVKLLRVLEARQFERVGGTETQQLKARIITATNKDLEKEVAEGRFREDFFYRINVINIHLPPLNERLDDLPLLVDYFMKKFKNKFNKQIDSVSPTAFRLLKNYNWPGNIRELENVLEHAFVVCKGRVIETEDLPQRLWSTLEQDTRRQAEKPGRDTVKAAEKELIIETLKKNEDHRGKTAEDLGIDKSTLWRKMKKYNLL